MRQLLENKIAKVDKKEAFCAIMFIFSGVLCATLYCLANKRMITEIYLPSGSWNDEAFYYKQVEAMIKYGIPQGYFGYAEQGAKYLTLGAWSPAILVPYVILGKIFGWGLLSPIFCNLFLFSIALFLFYLWVRPCPKSMVCFILMLMSSPIIIRYIISGMTETFFFASAILMSGMYYKLKKSYNDSFLIFTYLLIGYFTLARPYVIIMLLLPLGFWKKHHPSITCIAILSTVLWGSTIMIIYVLVNKYLCAPFFTPIIDNNFINNFQQGIVYGIGSALSKYFMGWKDIIGYLVAAFSGSDVGEYYFYFLIVSLVIFILLITDRKNKILIYTVLCNFIIISAVIMLYSTKSGGRHLLMFYVWGLIIISMQEKAWGKWLFAVMSIAVLLFVPKNDYTYTIPYRENAVVNENIEIREELSCILKLEDEVGWNNTIAWIVDWEYGICYFLPVGFGININYDGIGYDEIKSQYILVKEEALTNELIREKAEKIWEHNNYILYRKQ